MSLCKHVLLGLQKQKYKLHSKDINLALIAGGLSVSARAWRNRQTLPALLQLEQVLQSDTHSALDV